jgi:phenylalanyl-tRNA synthetase beta chain
MIGLGYNEVTTFVISNENDECTRLGLQKKKLVEIENPIGEEYSGLRASLLPSLLKLLRENRHHPLPQQIFEIGVVVDEQAKNRNRLAGMKIDAKAHFTECKSIVETVVRECGQKLIIKEAANPAFIDGRCAAVVHNGRDIGMFGEIHPRTIQEFSLEYPVIAFELAVDYLH